MSGVYEPGLEVGNSALFPLATIQSHSQRVLKERLGNVIQVVSPERKITWMWWFFHRCCCLPDSLVWTLLSPRVIWQQLLGQKSSLPSPLPHSSHWGAESLSRSGKTWASTWCSPWSPPTSTPPLWFHVFILWFYLSFSSDSPGLILYLSLSSTLSEYHPYCYASSWPLMSITTDSVSKFNISFLWRVTYLAGVFVELIWLSVLVLRL